MITQKQMARAIKAMEAAADALSPICAALEGHQGRDRPLTAALLLRNLREEADYLRLLTDNGESWLYRLGIFAKKRTSP